MDKQSGKSEEEKLVMGERIDESEMEE